MSVSVIDNDPTYILTLINKAICNLIGQISRVTTSIIIHTQNNNNHRLDGRPGVLF